MVSLRAQAPEGYVGAEACTKCHAGVQHEAAQSRHSRMMQRATPQSVEGNFAQGRVALHGSTYLLRVSGGDYFITESDLTGKPWEHRVEYTLGVRRVQHYITTLPDGRMILIPAAWDNVGKKWVHDVDVNNPEEAAGDIILVWNKTCFNCHVTREQKNFDSQKSVYHTTWQDLGVGCESCHGPGKEHVARPTKATIVNPARLDAARSTAVCAQCHSYRNIFADGFAAGANYYDYFLPLLDYSLPASDDPTFWADGRPRWLANEAGALWQSQCFLKGGATCLTCHSQPHNPDVERNPQLHAGSNAICAGCHKTIAANAAAHTHHMPQSSGSSCVGCHMPPSVTGLKAQMRDHSIGIPVPENTLRHGIPNACNVCHRDRDANWAARQVSGWYGPSSGRKQIQQADAFAQGRKRNPAAIPALLGILSDSSAGSWRRANAAGYLGAFPDDPRAYQAVSHAFSDSDPLVRATAATAIQPSAGQRETAATDLVQLLKDPARTVRISAGVAMAGIGVRPFPGEDGARYEQAKQLYRDRLALFSDQPEDLFNGGKLFLAAGDLNSAVSALRTSVKLSSSTPARYLLARVLASRSEFAEARQLLQNIPPADAGYSATQALLAEIDAKAVTGGGAAPKESPAQPQFLEGQEKFKSEFYQAALNAFEEALRVAPQSDWAPAARAYRAICLEKLSRLSEAEPALKALAEDPAAQQNLDLQLALVELLFETGRVDEAAKRIDATVAALPGAAPAYFWRAKVLLQLKQVGDAAAAAEQSVRLDGSSPQAHNLLIRIYQMQGRTKEAAQQAEWLRDYQRRATSH